MATRRKTSTPVRRRAGNDRVTRTALRAVGRRIANTFLTEKVILFGSYAYGRPTPDSDVDILVIMDSPLRPAARSAAISRLFDPRPFPMDILVQTPREIAERLALGDPFFREIIEHGRVLYERTAG